VSGSSCSAWCWEYGPVVGDGLNRLRRELTDFCRRTRT
jgi:hypothetical protein